MVKILFAASEVAPFAKTGGLGDVCSSLPRSLAEQGHEVAVFMPYYSTVRGLPFEGEDTALPIQIQIMDRMVGGKFFKGLLPHSYVPLYLLENHHYYSRDGIYNGKNGDFPDNVERYSFFCRAILEFCGRSGFFPDIIHCHDWQTALLPLYLKSHYRFWAHFQKTKTVFTIHNLAYQGSFWKEDLKITGLPWEFFDSNYLEYFDSLNFMKGGIAGSDFITTVSPTYAQEIQTPDGGFGLDGFLRSKAHKLVGIVNGIDQEVWDPATDPALPVPYHYDDRQGKGFCKQFVQKLYGLRVDPHIPLCSVVSRLTGQKGLSLVTEAIEYFLSQNRCQLVVLGSGEKKFADFFQYLSAKYPDLCFAHIGYSEELAHQFIAASDLFLMPSAFEPCGLTQLYSLRYGTVPLARATGGLVDTITPVTRETLRKGSATGFMFEEFSGHAFGATLDVALKIFQSKEVWEKIQSTGMAQDWSWTRSAYDYLRVYHLLLGT